MSKAFINNGYIPNEDIAQPHMDRGHKSYIERGMPYMETVPENGKPIRKYH